MSVQKDRLWGMWGVGGLGNLSGLCVMGLIHFERLFEIIYYLFNKGVLGREILRVFFVDTLFDFESEMIMYGGKFVQA